MNWEYGKLMLMQEDIDSLDDWSDEKEYVYSTMDRKYSYLWLEHNDDEYKYNFIDRIYADYRESFNYESKYKDELIIEKEKNNELELHFKNLTEAIKWIKNKEAKEKERKMKNNWTTDIYRIDFSYYVEGKGCINRNTVDRIENYLSAKEYIDEVYYNKCFPMNIEEEFKNYDVIKVEIIEIKTNKTLSTYWWGGNGKENKLNENG